MIDPFSVSLKLFLLLFCALLCAGCAQHDEQEGLLKLIDNGPSTEYSWPNPFESSQGWPVSVTINDAERGVARSALIPLIEDVRLSERERVWACYYFTLIGIETGDQVVGAFWSERACSTDPIIFYYSTLWRFNNKARLDASELECCQDSALVFCFYSSHPKLRYYALKSVDRLSKLDFTLEGFFAYAQAELGAEAAESLRRDFRLFQMNNELLPARLYLQHAGS